jgi:ATP-dependent helicase HrpA
MSRRPKSHDAPQPLTISYPQDLPVSQRREDIQAAIRDNQVVIIAGETGSGKTTQIPKMLLEMGYGGRGKLIGHTQPRRIAARSVASRIASELGQKLGEGVVGFQVRFTKDVARGARLKLMTDGILLAELGSDRLLKRYDAIIIDEAHERSLNIDVILGYLKQILPQRPDLKVIITSATIDPERFAAHFASRLPSGDIRPAPILEVSGRTYPVEIRYRPLVLDAEDLAEDADPDELEDIHSIERDLTGAILDAVDELAAEGPGDMLVFLPGEREIREAQESLQAHLTRRTGKGRAALPVEVLPLFGRLSAQDQHKIFSPPAAGTYRRIILATNVAETSLTVPGISYVIDSGLARISRYSQRTKVQRLPIEPISQASAAQRSGRSGRTSPGTAIRLYSQQDFESRPAFTEPEILRTSLASVVLLMTSLGLGDVESFPFVEPPATRAVTDGVRLLEELRAIEPAPSARGGRRLTDVGTTLARFPLDPRMARMLIEADRLGALREVLVIVAAMSIQDPRERPLGQEQQAKAKHKRFEDETSDFLAFLNLWNHLHERRKALSGSAFRREVRGDFLHYLRIREWRDMHSQLKEMAKDVGLRLNDNPASPTAIHQALLSGLLSHVGLYDDRTREYGGARGAHFALWPGSALAKKRPEFVMVAELVETSRSWGRTAAKIDPAWVEEVGAHAVRRTHSEPYWSSKRACAMAHEKVTLYGVPVIADHVVPYGRIDPELSRDIFLQNALVEGDWTTRHHFFRDNRALIERLEDLEAKSRRRDLLVSDEQLFRFYDQRVPRTVVSGRHFDAWWKKQRHQTPDLLTLTEQDLIAADDSVVGAIQADFPDTWVQGDLTLPLTYSFGEVGADGADGVTATIPLAVLNRVVTRGFDWLVPGMREELVTELIRSLPKPLRRPLVPAPEKAKAVASTLHDDDPDTGEPFVEAVADELVALPGVPDDLQVFGPEFDLGRLPAHLHMHFRVVDGKGKQIGSGDDLEALKTRLKQRVDASVTTQAEDVTRKDLQDFPAEGIPAVHQGAVGGMTVTGYPALVVRSGRDGQEPPVDLKVLATADEQALAHPRGVVALVDRQMSADLQEVLNSLPNPTKIAVAQSPYGSSAALLADASRAATADLVGDARAIRSRDQFDQALERVRSRHTEVAGRAVREAASALAEHARVTKAVSKVSSLAILDRLTEIRDHADSLVAGRFISRVGIAHLGDLVRYLKADGIRLDKLQENPDRDARLDWQVRDLVQYWDTAKGTLSAARRAAPDAERIPWLLEELRVSLFAQTLGTRETVSDKRIRSAISELAT